MAHKYRSKLMKDGQDFDGFKQLFDFRENPTDAIGMP
jgi:hypothetical protein